MTRKVRVTALSAVIALVLAAGPAMAQESATSRATFGNFTTDVDDFMDVRNWSGTEFDSLTYLGYGGGLDAGYARRLGGGGLYLGFYFSGNLFSTGKVKTEEETNTYYYDSAIDQSILAGTEKKTTFTTDKISFNNGIDVLLGVAGMGIKLGFAENITLYSNPDDTYTVTSNPLNGNRNVTNDVVDFSRVDNTLTPSLGWGMKLDLGGMVLKPKIGGSVSFVQKEESKTLRGTSTNSNIVTDTVSFKGDNSINPAVDVEIGLELAKNGASQMGFGVQYVGNFYLPSTDYDLLGNSGTVNGRVSYASGTHQVTERLSGYRQVSDSVSYGLVEKSESDHAITPSFWYTNDLSAQASFGIGAALGINFGSWSETTTNEYRFKTVTSQRDQLTTTETTTGSNKTEEKEYSSFGVNPEISFAGTLEAVPGVLKVNGGLKVKLPSYSVRNTTTTTGFAKVYTSKTVDETGAVTYNNTSNNTSNPLDHTDKVETNGNWSPVNVEAALGLTFFLSPEFVFDTAVNSGGNVTVMFTVKK